MTVPYTTKWSIWTMQREIDDGYVYAVDVVIVGIANNDPTHAIQFTETCRLKRPEGAMIPYEDLTENQVLEWVKAQWSWECMHGFNKPWMSILNKSFDTFFNKPKVAGGVPWTPNVGVGTT